MADYLIQPQPDDHRLTARVTGRDQNGQEVEAAVVVERPLTLYLNDQEIVTMMTVGDHPEFLAAGYLVNQNMLPDPGDISAIDYDDDLNVVVVRTNGETNYEAKLKRRTLTSGCAQGTVFGNMMERFEQVRLADDAIVKASWLQRLSRTITETPSLYLAAGAIHGCVLAHQDKPLIYMEDVGRHNAVDKIAGYMALKSIPAQDKILYTTGRLTSEMVIKTVQMEIPILVSRSGFTAWGVELAEQAELTLIGRAKGKRFIALAGTQRIQYDTTDTDDATDALAS